MNSIEKQRRKHAEYMRKWRAKNREHNLEYRRRYYAQNREQIRLLAKLSWEKKKNRVNANRRQQRKINPKKYRKYDRDRWNRDKERVKQRNRESYHRNRAKRLAYGKKYRREHPEVMHEWRKQNLDHLLEYNRNKREPCKPYQYARTDKCSICGLTNDQSLRFYGRRLDVHHLDGDLLNNSVENLVTMCRLCHPKIETIKPLIPIVE